MRVHQREISKHKLDCLKVQCCHQCYSVCLLLTFTRSQNVKFADDGTVWRTGSDIKRLAEEIEVDLKKIADWTKKWRMKINAEQTEYCIFFS